LTACARRLQPSSLDAATYRCNGSGSDLTEELVIREAVPAAAVSVLRTSIASGRFAAVGVQVAAALGVGQGAGELVLGDGHEIVEA
jgi:hypothetical protein